MNLALPFAPEALALVGPQWPVLIFLRVWLDRLFLIVGTLQAWQRGDVGTDAGARRVEGASIVVRNVTNFVLLRWSEINWPEAIDRLDARWDQFKAEAMMGWRHQTARLVSDVALVGFLPNAWQRGVRGFLSRRYARWAFLSSNLWRFLGLAMRRKPTPQTLGDMHLVQASLAGTVFNPARALLVLLAASIAWGVVGWFWRLPVVKGERDSERLAAKTAIDANATLEESLDEVEAERDALKAALQARPKQEEKAKAAFGAREEVRRAASAKAKGKADEIVSRNAGYDGAHPDGIYFAEWLRNRQNGDADANGESIGGSEAAGTDGAAGMLSQGDPAGAAPGAAGDGAQR